MKDPAVIKEKLW